MTAYTRYLDRMTLGQEAGFAIVSPRTGTDPDVRYRIATFDDVYAVYCRVGGEPERTLSRHTDWPEAQEAWLLAVLAGLRGQQ